MALIRPLTPAQTAQHRAFLKQLAKSGNAQEAAAASGVSLRTLNARRARHPAFAQDWAATLAAADARLGAKGGARPAGGGSGVTVSLRRDGRLQVRRARRDAVTREGEQRFLLALSATANITLSAAAAGASPAAFGKRRRHNPAFAREMAAALKEGYERLEQALIASWSPRSGDDAAWRNNAPPALPSMTPAQALQLLHLHHKEVNLASSFVGGRMRPGETRDQRSAKLRALYYAKLTADAEETVERETEQLAARLERLAETIALPDLGQVTGWSKADPAKTAAGAGKPFGGAMREGLSRQRPRG